MFYYHFPLWGWIVLGFAAYVAFLYYMHEKLEEIQEEVEPEIINILSGGIWLKAKDIKSALDKTKVKVGSAIFDHIMAELIHRRVVLQRAQEEKNAGKNIRVYYYRLR